jgi:hypothetical protein
LDSIPHLKSIKNLIINSASENILHAHATIYDRQPFLNIGWTIYKMRWAIDNKGKSSGLRIIFCLNEGHMIFSYVATKNECADERLLESEFLQRIKEYLF